MRFPGRLNWWRVYETTRSTLTDSQMASLPQATTRSVPTFHSSANWPKSSPEYT